MPTTNPVTFRQYEYGHNSDYAARYCSFLEENASNGVCCAASLHFLRLAISGDTIDINISTLDSKSIMVALLEQQPALRCVVKLEKKINEILNLHPGNHHSRGFSNDTLVTKDYVRIINKIKTNKNKFPCGIITTSYIDSGHVTAYACDSHHLYFYDPNHGIMRVNRYNDYQLYRVFHSYVGSEPGAKLKKITLTYCINPVRVALPSAFYTGAPRETSILF
jgi:hypothetical protein